MDRMDQLLHLTSETKEAIQQIVAIEWVMFDRVNEGICRASCQEDPRTFQLMRYSQFMAWNIETLQSYEKDLLRASAEGLNLVKLKYFYMMQSREDLAIANTITEEKFALVDEIVAQMNVWSDQLVRNFPELKSHCRPLHDAEAKDETTSIETYQYGELYTYSVDTLSLLLAHIQKLTSENKNLSFMIVKNTALLAKLDIF